MTTYTDQLKSLAVEILDACTEENKRGGCVEAYNMPPSVNEKIFALYEEFACSVKNGSRRAWANGLGMGNEQSILNGFTLSYYGKNANKFYVHRVTQEQSEKVIHALAKAAQENERY